VDRGFVVPNSWFGVFDNVPPPITQACLDGSYDGADITADRMLAYGGLFGNEDAWHGLAAFWEPTLKGYGIDAFRTTELRHRRDIDAIREALAVEAHKCGLHGVAVVASEALLDRKASAGKRELFGSVVTQLLEAAPSFQNIALICDREQDLAGEVFAWMERLRWQSKQDVDRDLYERITGICWMNSRQTIQIQAADMVSGLAREFGRALLRADDAEPPRALATVLTMRVGRVSRAEFLRDS
jgi:hypothetical protein